MNGFEFVCLQAVCSFHPSRMMLSQHTVRPSARPLQLPAVSSSTGTSMAGPIVMKLARPSHGSPTMSDTSRRWISCKQYAIPLAAGNAGQASVDQPDICGHHASTRLLEDRLFLPPIGENRQAGWPCIERPSLYFQGSAKHPVANP